MNPQIVDLLRQALNLMPSFHAALANFVRVMPTVVASVSGLVGAVARTGVIQAALSTGIGQLIATAGGMALRGAGAALGTVGAGVAAAAATPMGQVAIAAGGVAAAFAALGVVTERTGRSFLETQRHLAEHSAALAQVFAQSDIRRVMREMKAGGDQATTAGFLARSLDSLADTLQPILSLLANVANVVLGSLATVVDLLVAPISAMAQGIMDIFAWLRRRWPFGGDTADPKTLSQWLDDMSTQARQERNLPWVPRGRFVPAGP